MHHVLLYTAYVPNAKGSKFMPIYEYECAHCGQRFDKLQPVTAERLTECVLCGQGPVRRVIQPVGVIFKGSGWYATDSRSDNKPKTSKADDKPKSDSSDSAPSSPPAADAGEKTVKSDSAAKE